ncbi:unnamed protein product [Bursaphelenchus xylophilus]|uniref:(pine wood nematode) hypothetical protein n=1 Tax=Bursaphelenchus xylophilus TaxID=6326 RepID=A0A1I7S8B5_BURXY|nr:unnamed protein product [Bursaphelenchus xylophilus]CAG9080310.1 unnamed protein product [Bursaphelenchus xylophilus]
MNLPVVLFLCFLLGSSHAQTEEADYDLDYGGQATTNGPEPVPNSTPPPTTTTTKTTTTPTTTPTTEPAAEPTTASASVPPEASTTSDGGTNPTTKPTTASVMYGLVTMFIMVYIIE